ncbi:transcription factor IIIA-like [Corythoichthys intestinalis]|uniref:transcription factor IIIA-like n=1 Tax=Corythoichthys intestinalis TaxID=161448 RepID=UPI0025A6508E|nr:transcription factor IIIA-like [Corythoichthys intestinalis]XP_061792244.1 transcription factor IIIA-like [Nerophis lumbriciformis]
MEGAAPQHKRYICSFTECLAAYNKQWKLDAHMCSHTGIKPHACPQDGCAKSFTSSYHLARHQLTHSGLRPFPCEVTGCGEAFTTNANRVRHVSRVHAEGETKRYVCTVDVCDAVFKKHQQLKAHMSESHTHVPAYACTHEGCDKRFSFPSRLKRHLKVHQGYPCNLSGCTFTGSTWTEYVKHRKEQHRRQAMCPECGKSFKDNWFLEQHRRVHADTRKVYRCPRDTCDRSFTTTFNLQSHLRTFHDERRPFSCDHPGCERTFAMKQSLQRHSVVHDPQRKKMTRPKRSLASRLSGCSDKMAKSRVPETQKPPGPVELVHLLQDTALLGGTPQEL